MDGLLLNHFEWFVIIVYYYVASIAVCVKIF